MHSVGPQPPAGETLGCERGALKQRAGHGHLSRELREESEQRETTPAAGRPRRSPVTHPDGFLVPVLEAGSRMQLEHWGNPSWSQHPGGPRVSGED